mmetsp:Transcript_35013/g.76592  ORF Transcript_35013/g.76592 Transcript_35013/m.76592 type:complete len:94 (-) Transcript_35013:86-367(-)|eukprot:CAMPEP_0178658416 /NCGR_PEP_ID=MMETSP0698-20121128/25968_1 /TAXON_ID=265572 /ORGANISM="Extubocellulus spinifer, Strain CCMP396" /LENGTH=93 /DNA_ID=CAMNT_0020300781 /DNA_START=96 /DNA_END=377 /DNA_ORIENTATION=+
MEDVHSERAWCACAVLSFMVKNRSHEHRCIEAMKSVGADYDIGDDDVSISADGTTIGFENYIYCGVVRVGIPYALLPAGWGILPPGDDSHGNG